MNLIVNSDFDLDFKEVQKKLTNQSIAVDFEKVYDFAKRFINKYGICAKTIEKIYLLGYIQK